MGVVVVVFVGVDDGLDLLRGLGRADVVVIVVGHGSLHRLWTAS